MTEKILLLFSAMRDKRTPWYAKAMVGLVLAYIVSPIDIIPDFIPVIGLLDEVILVPIVLAIIFKLIPVNVRQEALLKQIGREEKKKLITIGILLVLSIWLILLFILMTFIFEQS
jgi:uncharacterized membrane protein YkvA (DUF1232 family)